MSRKPLKLAVWKFASCDGCQLSLLDCEDELLPLMDRVLLANFREASSRIVRGPYDLSLVEGSITTPDDIDQILKIRKQSRTLITIGACATAGGIQALRNFTKISQYVSAVYPDPSYVRTLEQSWPIASHVKVDFELVGCPVNKQQLLEVIKAQIDNRIPRIAKESVCAQCKIHGYECILVSRGQPCMGPITQAGCEALCPAFSRPCYGCFGPKENLNLSSLSDLWKSKGLSASVIEQMLKSFNAAHPSLVGKNISHEK